VEAARQRVIEQLEARASLVEVEGSRWGLPSPQLDQSLRALQAGGAGEPFAAGTRTAGATLRAEAKKVEQQRQETLRPKLQPQRQAASSQPAALPQQQQERQQQQPPTSAPPSALEELQHVLGAYIEAVNDPSTQVRPLYHALPGHA
jgi:hypothetical protein